MGPGSLMVWGGKSDGMGRGKSDGMGQGKSDVLC